MSILNNNYNMRVISAFILPLAIYGLNTFEGIFRLPLFVVGFLVFLKAFLDLNAIQRSSRPVQKKQTRAFPLLHCYLCKKEAMHLTPYHAQGKRMALCDRCHACIQFTDRCA